MSKTLLSYTYTCSAGEIIRDDWREIDQGDPVVCRNNTSHTVVGIPIVVERVDSSEVTVKEVQTVAGSNSYAFDTIEFTAFANSTTIGEEHWDDDINVLSFTYVTAAEHTGDTFYASIADDSEVCSLAAELPANSSTIIIPSAVFLPYLCRGYRIKIREGDMVNDVINDLGFIRGINYSNCTITVSNPTVNNFGAGAKLLITRVLAGRTGPIEIGPAWSYTIGDDKIGASYVPAGKSVRITYNNKSNTDKRFVVIVRYLY